MTLELKSVTKRVGADVHIHETNLVLEEGSFNILLGTDARRQDDADAADGRARSRRPPAKSGSAARTSPACRCRSATSSMVYQQFINYPNFTVYENIASPLARRRRCRTPRSTRRVQRGRRAPAPDADARAAARASCPAASSSAPRSPARWSRIPTSSCSTSRSPISTTSCARSCATSCPSFRRPRSCIVVYATTEPTEALLFGGNTATLHEGRVTQFGPTAEIYRKPVRPDRAPRSSPTRRSTRPRSPSGAPRSSSATPSGCPPANGGEVDTRRPLHDRHPARITSPRMRSVRRAADDRGHGAGHRAERLRKRRPFRHERPDLGVAVARHPSLRRSARRPSSTSMSIRASSSTTTASLIDGRRADGQDHARGARATATFPNPKRDDDWALKQLDARAAPTAAPMRCSGRPAAARPRCST